MAQLCRPWRAATPGGVGHCTTSQVFFLTSTFTETVYLERRGNAFKPFNDFDLKVEAKNWPVMSQVCRTRSTARYPCKAYSRGLERKLRAASDRDAPLLHQRTNAYQTGCEDLV